MVKACLHRFATFRVEVEHEMPTYFVRNFRFYTFKIPNMATVRNFEVMSEYKLVTGNKNRFYSQVMGIMHKIQLLIIFQTIKI
jgi:hypothetical protein